MESSDIQSVIGTYQSIDDQLNTIVAIGSKESFFNNIMSYGISVKDVYKLLETEKSRRDRLNPLLDSLEYKLISLLRKDINCYWEIYYNENVDLTIGTGDLSSDVLTSFLNIGVVLTFDTVGKFYYCVIHTDDPKQFLKNCISVDLNTPAVYGYSYDKDYKGYTSSCKF